MSPSFDGLVFGALSFVNDNGIYAYEPNLAKGAACNICITCKCTSSFYVVALTL